MNNCLTCLCTALPAGHLIKTAYLWLLFRLSSGIFHYPEPDAGSFRKVAAAYHGLTPEQVLVGNGATELFYMVAHAFSGNRTLIPVPSFTEYEDACTLYDHHIQFVGQVDVEHIPEHTNLMFICNPNNPDGRIWNLEEITALVKNYPDMMLVVDESFIHFAPGTESEIRLSSNLWLASGSLGL